jgi:hypothetical protein
MTKMTFHFAIVPALEAVPVFFDYEAIHVYEQSEDGGHCLLLKGHFLALC